MSIAHYIKEIGRGKEGARSLSREQAYDLMCRVLDGRVGDLELGAFAVAMRIKGESVDELAGFLQSVEERCLSLDPPRPLVLLPTYNGARRLPNLTALLALLLAREGAAVLVHGLPDDPTRVTTAQVFAALGVPAVASAHEARCRWACGLPAYMDIQDLCPPLARLLGVRWAIGLRNPGHTVAKLLGLGTGLRVVNYTHPEYGELLTHFLQVTRAHAALMRGTEGEPYADPRRMPGMTVFLQGARQPELDVPPQSGVLTAVPTLPAPDAAATAAYIGAVLEGKMPVPEPLRQQVRCLMDTLQRLPAQRSLAGEPIC